MKKIIEILIVIAILFAMAALVSCEEKTEANEVAKKLQPSVIYFNDENGNVIEYVPKSEPNEPKEISFQELLIRPPVEWIEQYGDGLESQQTANIVLAIQVINRQGEAIKELDRRLVALEKIDPNGVK